MLRWLGIILAIGLVSASADAQVFKPKSKKAAATEKKAEPAKKKTAKKQPRAGATKKRPKKKATSETARVEEDEAPEVESKVSAKDYVKIWDDDQIE
jgi:hypothetical protein